MSASKWLSEIAKQGKVEADWRDSARKVVDIFRDDDSDSHLDNNRTNSFNILWSNTETLKPALYSNSPKPDIRRRHLDEDKVALEATEVLNRALAFCIDTYDFDEVMEDCVEDYLLPGRGIAREKYKPTFEEVDVRVPVSPNDDGSFDKGVEFDEEGAFKIDKVEQLINEEVVTEYVYWEDLRIGPARKWKNIPWMAFGTWMTKDDLEDAFGADVASSVPFGEEFEKKERKFEKQARVWQVWEKESRKVYMVAEGFDKFLEKPEKDPLTLEGFYPAPEPLYSIKTNNTLIPRPEYAIYQDQAEELNIVTQRITALTDALRRRGVYDAGFEELAQLADAGDNEFIPVSDFASKVIEGGGLAALMPEAPIDKIANTVLGLYRQRTEIKQIIFEITGISDIQRGSTKASETLGAQQIKAQFGSLRLQPRQKKIQRFARDLLRIKAEIIGEHFSKETIERMVGMPVSDEAYKLIQSDKDRGFRIDIETDSTISPDIDSEQKNRIEFLTAVTGFITQMAPLVQQGAIPPETAKQLFMFAVRSFKIPPALEDAVDKIGAGNKDEQAMQQRIQQQIQQAEQQIQAREQEAQKLEAQAKSATDDAKVAQANVRLEEERLGRKMDALKAQEKFIALFAKIETMNMEGAVKDAVEELSDPVKDNETGEST